MKTTMAQPEKSKSSEPVRVVTIPPLGLAGLLGFPKESRGMVAFAHGSGSGRLSPRNQFVAAALRRSGLATLLFDLLTDPEAANRRNVFDIPLLSDRLLQATRWIGAQSGIGALPLGYFGASTGAAAALVAAAHVGSGIAAVVSRGGRPDLAGPALPLVTAPTLLIVGGADDVVLELNREALGHLTCEKRLTVVPGATHLFEEPGALEKVVDHAQRWFVDNLVHDEDKGA
jgi:dienelactone hydrolase